MLLGSEGGEVREYRDQLNFIKGLYLGRKVFSFQMLIIINYDQLGEKQYQFRVETLELRSF